MPKIVKITGVLWGGEPGTADHHPIATVNWSIDPDASNDPAVIRGVDKVRERLDRLAQWGSNSNLDNLGWGMAHRLGYPEDRVMFANVSVSDWFTIPEWWEILVTDSEGNEYKRESAW